MYSCVCAHEKVLKFTTSETASETTHKASIIMVVRKFQGGTPVGGGGISRFPPA